MPHFEFLDEVSYSSTPVPSLAFIKRQPGALDDERSVSSQLQVGSVCIEYFSNSHRWEPFENLLLDQKEFLFNINDDDDDDFVLFLQVIVLGAGAAEASDADAQSGNSAAKKVAIGLMHTYIHHSVQPLLQVLH